MSDLVDRLEAIRAAHGWTLKEMAEHLGMSEAMYRAIKYGTSGIGIRTLGAIRKNEPGLRDAVDAFLIDAADKEDAVAA